jgi:dimethylhistidine N-methyltransferase
MHQKPSVNARQELLQEILDGLGRPEKSLPCKLFYDARGSRLFDEICELEEYYPTRTEMSIMRDHVDEIAAMFTPGTLFVEFGSGSSLKTRLLLDRLPHLAGYVPVDISAEHLAEAARHLQAEYPALEIYPLPADYTREVRLPDVRKPVARTIVYFPGSTIGNFTRREADLFLDEIAGMVGMDGGLLIGVDLKKDRNILESAYNDSRGITAAFNLNILRHLNDEFAAGFREEDFEHYAFYNEPRGRIEMHLRCGRDHSVSIGGREIRFHAGEFILTEHSHKYTLAEFARLAGDRLRVARVWTDPRQYFSVQFLTVIR